MSDKMTPEQRHRCMSRVRSKDTKPELLVRKYLFSHGFRYRVCVKELPGKPDIVLSKYRTVIFVNGCFWHGHGCGFYSFPKTNVGFWEDKIRRNRERDRKEEAALRRMGWHVIRIWECQLKPKVRMATLESLAYTLNRIFLSGIGADVRVNMYEERMPETGMAAESVAEYGKENNYTK